MGCQNGKSSERLAAVKIKRDSQGNKMNECKIVVMGDIHVGKSSISQRFCNNVFSDNYEVTLAGAYLVHTYKLKNNITLKMNIWDTAGEEKFRSILPMYYREADAALLVYDITEQKSFQSIEFWRKEFESRVERDGFIIALAGNKCDLEEKREVSFEEGKTYANSSNMICFETSAKNGEGVQEIFRDLAEEVYKSMVKHKKI